VHRFGDDWEAKLTYNHRHSDEATKLFYAYTAFTTPPPPLNNDNTGLTGYPYRSLGDSTNNTFDANLSGHFTAFGRKHGLLVGLSRAKEETNTDYFPALTNAFQPLPAFPYAGNVSPEPDWGPRTFSSAGEQTLTRLYITSRLSLSDSLNAIAGVNAARLERGGGSRYGSSGQLLDPKTEKVSPYLGFTYDVTPDLLGYVSYSDIFQAQEQPDINGNIIAPMKGVNTEAGVKAEWFGKSLLTTFALFSAKQQGLAKSAGYVGTGNDAREYYVPKDVKSQGFELEASGRLGKDTKLTVGFTHMKLTGPDGQETYEWEPRTTANFRADARVPTLPALRVGLAARWQSDVYNKDSRARQDAYVKADAFAAYELNDKATLRLNVNNLFDKKAVGGLGYGAIYIPPRNYGVSLNYKL
jgi:outer membrane receptor for ferric coprogen and ferric-rhodotorulic acid